MLREDQGNARVEDLQLSRDEEKKVPEREGDHGGLFSLSTHWVCAQGHLLPPEGGDRPALSSPSPLPGFWAGVGRNSRTLLLQTNFGRWVGTCSQVTQLSGAGAGGGVPTGQKGVKGPGVSGLGLGRVGQGWPRSIPLKRERHQPYLH